MMSRMGTSLAAIGLLAAVLTVAPGGLQGPEKDDRSFDAFRPPGQVSVAEGGQAREPEVAQGAFSLLNDPYVGRQWALKQIGLPELSVTRGGRGVIVAVLDTGIDRDHEDLGGKVVGEVNFTDSPVTADINGHGTHVAGIIAAENDNGLGVAGVAPLARLLNVKVADDYGVCEPAAVARGIVWAVDHGATVINVSLQFKEPSAALEKAVDYAWGRGVVIVAAAGNDASEIPVYPAYYARVIAVSAVGQRDELAPLSNYGDWVDVAAPGLRIYSTLPSDEYGYETGTSFAAAYVSAVAALAFNLAADDNGDGRLNDEVRTLVEGSTSRLNVPGTGHGLINAAVLFAGPR